MFVYVREQMIQVVTCFYSFENEKVRLRRIALLQGGVYVLL